MRHRFGGKNNLTESNISVGGAEFKKTPLMTEAVIIKKRKQMKPRVLPLTPYSAYYCRLSR